MSGRTGIIIELPKTMINGTPLKAANTAAFDLGCILSLHFPFKVIFFLYALSKRLLHKKIKEHWGVYVYCF